jgi:hypothetical protein
MTYLIDNEDGGDYREGMKYVAESHLTTDQILKTYYYDFKSPYRNSDIDLFLYGLTPQEAEDKIVEIYNTIKNNVKEDVLIVRTKLAVTFQTRTTRPIQVILRIYKSPTEIISGFDIDACAVVFDGFDVYALPRARRAITKRYNMVDPDRQSYTYEYRLFKYATRGFRVCIPGFNPTFVKREGLLSNDHTSYSIPRPSVQYCRGLARLLLYEYRYRFRLTDHRRTNDSIIGIDQQFRESLIADQFQHDSDYSGRYVSFNYYRQQMQNVEDQFNRHVSGTLGDSMYEKIAQGLNKVLVTLNNIQGIIHTTKDLDLPAHIQFITENPARQYDTSSEKVNGSFHPLFQNFYEDAYLNYDELAALRVKQGYKEIGTWFEKSHYGFSSFSIPRYSLRTSLLEEAYKSGVRKTILKENVGHFGFNLNRTAVVDFDKMELIDGGTIKVERYVWFSYDR